MKIQPYSIEIDRFDLSDTHALIRAKNDEFLKFWAVYRNTNEDFSRNFQAQYAELAGLPFCFWIVELDKRIGGVLLLPNNLGDFFLIPPFQNAAPVFRDILTRLEAWSAPKKGIRAQGITDAYVQDFRSLGFEIEESRCWMVRPTEVEKSSWDDEWTVQPLVPADAPNLATLLFESFRGGIGNYGKRDLSRHRRTVDRFFEDFDPGSLIGRASMKISHKDEKSPVAVCMVTIHKGMPTIQFTAVAPNYRRRGLAANMIRQSITTIAPAFDHVKLAVTIGNPAQILYSHLSFISGDTVHALFKPIN